MFDESRKEQNSSYNLEMTGPTEKDACPYYDDVRSKKLLCDANGATEREKTFEFTLDYIKKLACRQDLDTHSAEPTTGSDMNYSESADYRLEVDVDFYIFVL